MLDLNNLHNYRENNRIEAKEALGGLPESLWETYSAFANADGGVLLLGVQERADHSLQPVDLLDPAWLIEEFLAIVNDPARVSANILSPEDIRVHLLDGKRIISITIPPAPAQQKPIYLLGDPYWESYIRRGEGDCRCTREEVEQMLRLANRP